LNLRPANIHSKNVTCFTTLFSLATYSIKPLILFQNLNIYISNSYSTQHSCAASVSNSTKKEITRKKNFKCFFYTVITITIMNLSIHTLTDYYTQKYTNHKTKPSQRRVHALILDASLSGKIEVIKLCKYMFLHNTTISLGLCICTAKCYQCVTPYV